MARARLLLLTPPASDPAALLAPVEAALDAGEPVASVVIAGAPSDHAAGREPLKRLIGAIQAKGAAALLPPPVDLRQVARLGADGVHWTATGLEEDAAALALLLEAMRGERITGAGGLGSRDAAMAAGEAGVDYVMFGEPGRDGLVPPLAAVCERCQWWAELFLVPAVGYAPTLETVEALARTGIEFVALGGAVWTHADGPAAGIRKAALALDRAAGPSQESAPASPPPKGRPDP